MSNVMGDVNREIYVSLHRQFLPTSLSPNMRECAEIAIGVNYISDKVGAYDKGLTNLSNEIGKTQTALSFFKHKMINLGSSSYIPIIDILEEDLNVAEGDFQTKKISGSVIL